MEPTRIRALALAAVAAGVVLPAAADVPPPAGYFVQGGVTGARTWNAGVGLVWPWAWRSGLMGAEIGGITEAYVSHWSTRPATGRRGFTQLGVVPLLRLRFDQGRSPWFAEAGIGLSVMDQHFVTATKQFGTSFNFVDVIGIGRSFGPDRAQEFGVRLQHVSNAGFRAPNPGQNFVQLRYASRF